MPDGSADLDVPKAGVCLEEQRDIDLTPVSNRDLEGPTREPAYCLTNEGEWGA